MILRTRTSESQQISGVLSILCQAHLCPCLARRGNYSDAIRRRAAVQTSTDKQRRLIKNHQEHEARFTRAALRFVQLWKTNAVLPDTFEGEKAAADCAMKEMRGKPSGYGNQTYSDAFKTTGFGVRVYGNEYERRRSGDQNPRRSKFESSAN